MLMRPLAYAQNSLCALPHLDDFCSPTCPYDAQPREERGSIRTDNTINRFCRIPNPGTVPYYPAGGSGDLARSHCVRDDSDNFCFV